MSGDKYKKIVPPIEAIQYLREENIHDVIYFFEKVGDHKKLKYLDSINEYGLWAKLGLAAPTLLVLQHGQYISRDINGEYTVQSAESFERQHERIDE